VERVGPQVSLCPPGQNSGISNIIFLKARSRDPTVNAIGEMQSSALQKVAAALRVLTYGMPADEVDEYSRLSHSTINETVNRFTRFVVEKYKPVYLLEPTRADLQGVMDDCSDAGFSGCMGCVDCSFWVWRMCPVAFHGQYQGKSKKRSIVLETVADKELYLWHFYISLPNTINDLNVMAFSPCFNSMTSRSFPPPIPYTVNGVERTLLYVLCDGIYPKLEILIGASTGESEKEQYFASHQEGRRKDAERIYAYLCCAALHNMAVSQGRKGPAVPQPGMCTAALLIFSFRLCPLFLLFNFLLVLTCYLFLKTGSGHLSLSLYARGGAPSCVRRDRLLIRVGTAVRQSNVVDLLEMRRLQGEGYSPGRGLQTIQRDAWKICKPSAAGSRARLNTTRASMNSWSISESAAPRHNPTT